MNYTEYDLIQSDLGAVADSYKSTCKEILSNSNADDESKELLQRICTATEDHLHTVALLISKTARLMTK